MRGRVAVAAVLAAVLLSGRVTLAINCASAPFSCTAPTITWTGLTTGTFGDPCAAYETMRRNSTDASTECFTPLAGVERNNISIGAGPVINFSSEFEVSQGSGQIDVAIGSTVVVTADGTIQKADLISAHAYEDEANSFGDNLQLVNRWVYENNAGTDRLDCGNTADNACRYSGDYSNTDDLVTKGDVDAHYTFQMVGNITGGASTTTTAVYSSYTGVKQTQEFFMQVPVTVACTAKNARGVWWRFGGAFPSGATFTVTLRKNAADTTITNAITALAGSTGSFTDADTVSFAAGDLWTVRLQCTGTCTDATTVMGVWLVVDCVAG